jgi:hypothetical protein
VWRGILMPTCQGGLHVFPLDKIVSNEISMQLKIH